MVVFRKKGYKYFTAYKDSGKIICFCIILPNLNISVKHFDETKYMSFLIKDNELLKKMLKS